MLINETITVSRELTPPLFWIDQVRVEVRALLNDSTYAEAFISDGYSSCRIVDANTCNAQIATAYKYWTPITEQEFFDFYYNVHNSLSLKPELCVKS